MSKRKANNKSGVNVVTKKKCSLKFNPEWLIEVAKSKTELPIWYRKQLISWETSSLIVKAVTTLFAKYAKKLVQADTFTTHWKTMKRSKNRLSH